MGYQGVKYQESNGNNLLIINFLVSSEKRENLLRILRDGPKKLHEIRDFLDVSSSGIIPEIRKMEEKNLVHQINREYVLTEIGEVVAESISQLEGILRTFNMYTKFWSQHNISCLPWEFRLRIQELGNYEIIRSTPNDIFKPQKEYLKNILNAKWMKAISPVLHPDYPEYVIDLADRGVPVSIIVTEELLETLKEKYKEEMIRGLKYENTNIMVFDGDLGLSFSVTDFFLSMRFFLKDGTYDFYQNILSYDASALRWGEDIFNYYARQAKKLRLADL